jgi:hypothetical protein
MTPEEGNQNIERVAKKIWAPWFGGGTINPEKSWEQVAVKDSFYRMAVWALDEIATDPTKFTEGWAELRIEQRYRLLKPKEIKEAVIGRITAK